MVGSSKFRSSFTDYLPCLDSCKIRCIFLQANKKATNNLNRHHRFIVEPMSGAHCWCTVLCPVQSRDTASSEVRTIVLNTMWSKLPSHYPTALHALTGVSQSYHNNGTTASYCICRLRVMTLSRFQHLYQPSHDVLGKA